MNLINDFFRVTPPSSDVLFESHNSGEYEKTLYYGKYEFVLIGTPGANARQTSLYSSSVLNYSIAAGGVGGTIIAQLIITEPVNITINIPRYGQYLPTEILGLNGFVLSAGSGTGAIVTSATSVGIPGIMGANTTDGDFVSLISNPNNIISTAQTGRSTQPPLRDDIKNINYPSDTSIGSNVAQSGYVKIRVLPM